MIKDNIKNSEIYYNLSNYIKAGLIWLKETDLENVACGKHVIHGDKVFANIQEYDTKLDAKYEAHRKYIDIQYIISGSEKIGVTPIENCTTTDNYNSDTDLEFMNINKEDEYFQLNKNEFLILYPHDAHKPSISLNKTANRVKKVVIKVAVN